MRSPSRSSRATGASRWIEAPLFRAAAAMFSNSTLMPCRGYMYLVK
jgi:hypothetical protein